MLFNSLQFLAFFLIVTPVYFLLPHRARWAVLLGASCYFYMAFIPAYILILGFTIVVDYFAGLAIERAKSRTRKLLLLASLVANIGTLAVFKYYNFFNASFGEPLPALAWILPIGLSFHTFQAMSYTIEVYRGHQRAERHFGIYALYVMFYPQLVAGPIERPQNLLPQFHTPRTFSFTRVTSGMRLMLWGTFKKVVVADRLALIVDAVYDHPGQHGGVAVLVATYCFAFQIFADFSGYSDIAIGAARVMGFDLMTNFRTPYFAQSIREFWQRWHISLSTWFRDYVYIPLGGNRAGRSRWLANLMIVFLLSGLWHGANWTFVVWGSLHGLYLVIGILTHDARARLSAALGWHRLPRVHAVIRTIVVFNLVAFAWIFFRASSMTDAFVLIKALGTSIGNAFLLPEQWVLRDLLFLFWLVAMVHLFERKGVAFLDSPHPTLRVALVSALFWGTLVFGAFDNKQFVYFQF